MMNEQYRQIERELEEAEKEINRLYDDQIREVQNTSGLHENALKEKQRRLEEQRDEKIKGVRESMEEKRIRVKDIPENFADRAIDDVKQFFNNRN